MPRRGGGGGRSSGGFGRSGSGRSGGMFGGSRGARAAPKPAPARPTQQKSGGLFGGGSLGSTMAQGAAFGVGSGVAHAAVNSVLGGRGHGSGEAPPASSEGGYAEGAQSGYYEEGKEQVQENPCMSFNNMFMQ